MGRSMTEINQETCKKCGLCAKACAAKIIREIDGEFRVVPYPDWGCIKCGLCMAVCPTKTILVPGLNYDDFARLPRTKLGFDSLYDTLLCRRSVRSYKKDPVPRDILNSIIRAAATAPMGVPPSNVEVLIFDKRDDIEELLVDTAKGYEGLLFMMGNPVLSQILRLSQSRIMYNNIKRHVVPAARLCLENRKSGRDTFTYGAPAVMLFHIEKRGESISEDCWIAASYASIAAQSLGLGSCFIGMIPPIVDRSKKLKVKLKIPEENRVFACMITGYPDIKFKRMIPRELGAVRFVSEG